MATSTTTLPPISETWTSTPLISKINIGGTNYFIKDEESRAKINAIIPTLKAGIQLKVVETLPTASESCMGIIYLVKLGANDGASETNNIYREYICIKADDDTYSWESLGDTRVDLTDYEKVSQA